MSATMDYEMGNTDASPLSLCTFQTLPAEILDLIMLWSARVESAHKNHLVQRRLLCKAFDKAIRSLVFKGIRLDFSTFVRSATTCNIPDLMPVAGICEAVYLDLMVVRDEEEVTSLTNMFGNSHPLLPHMAPLSTLFRQYCMGTHTFDETDFRSKLTNVIQVIPNLKRFRINLPVQVVGSLNFTSTLLLATTLSVLANNRPEEHKPLETLVIDHFGDVSLDKICHNHMDLLNCLKVFQSLKHLILSLKRNEAAVNGNVLAVNLWFWLRLAKSLESLSLTGWNSRRVATLRKLQRGTQVLGQWQSQGLPYHLEGAPAFRNLRFLELKRVSTKGPTLIKIIAEASASLKELYLNEVCLKIWSKFSDTLTPLWIGHSRFQRRDETCWIADSLRQMEGLKLDVLRVTGLGYDDFETDDQSPLYPDYDLDDPALPSQSFDQRFVDAVMEPDHPPPNTDAIKAEVSSLSLPTLGPPHPLDAKPEYAYDAETYQTMIHNPTSFHQHSIDGLFRNHNEGAFRQLGAFVSMADRVMGLMSEWVDRVRRTTVIDGQTGALRTPAPVVTNLPPSTS